MINNNAYLGLRFASPKITANIFMSLYEYKIGLITFVTLYNLTNGTFYNKI